MCPDQLDNRGTCSSDVLDVSGFSGNRQQCVSFTRPFTTGMYMHVHVHVCMHVYVCMYAYMMY